MNRELQIALIQKEISTIDDRLADIEWEQDDLRSEQFKLERRLADLECELEDLQLEQNEEAELVSSGRVLDSTDYQQGNLFR